MCSGFQSYTIFNAAPCQRLCLCHKWSNRAIWMELRKAVNPRFSFFNAHSSRSVTLLRPLIIGALRKSERSSSVVYRDRLKSTQILLSRTQARPDRTSKNPKIVKFYDFLVWIVPNWKLDHAVVCPRGRRKSKGQTMGRYLCTYSTHTWDGTAILGWVRFLKPGLVILI